MDSQTDMRRTHRHTTSRMTQHKHAILHKTDTHAHPHRYSLALVHTQQQAHPRWPLPHCPHNCARKQTRLLPTKPLPGSGESRLIKPSQETGIFLAVLLPLAARGPPAQVAFVMGPQATLSPASSPSSLSGPWNDPPTLLSKRILLGQMEGRKLSWEFEA